MEELKALKNVIRSVDCKYVSSEEKDNEILIRLSYKKRNYILRINKEYGIIMLEQIDSLDSGFVGYDEYYLLDDIRRMLPYTEFKEYKSYLISYSEFVEHIMDDTILGKNMEMTFDSPLGDALFGRMELSEIKGIDGELIKCYSGLNKFDDRLFEKDWIEDFNEKVSTYSEKDLFIIISTIRSYLYKVSIGMWGDEKIDPFVLDYVSELAVTEVKNI